MSARIDDVGLQGTVHVDDCLPTRAYDSPIGDCTYYRALASPLLAAGATPNPKVSWVLELADQVVGYPDCSSNGGVAGRTGSLPGPPRQLCRYGFMGVHCWLQLTIGRQPTGSIRTGNESGHRPKPTVETDS